MAFVGISEVALRGYTQNHAIYIKSPSQCRATISSSKPEISRDHTWSNKEEEEKWPETRTS